MTGITHKQARRAINALADALIEEQEREDLNAHLETCEECRAYATQVKDLESGLQQSFHQRWDFFHGPSEKLAQNVQSRAKGIVMSNRINLGLRVMVGVGVLIVLGIAFNLAIGQLKSRSANNPTAGSTVTISATATGSPTTTAVSSSARLIALVSEQTGNADIYVMQTDGSSVTDLTNNPSYDGNPVWSPDGTKIAFESDRNGNRDIFVMNPDGSGLAQLTHDTGNNVLGVPPNPNIYRGKAPDVWSPDGRHILFSNDSTGQWVLSVMNADGSGMTQLLQANDPPVQTALWSPSGRQVAYISQTGNNWMQIVAVNIDGSNRRVIATGDPAKSNEAWRSGRMIAWSQDEQFFYFEYDTGDGHWSILKTTTDGAATSQVVASGYALPVGDFSDGWLGNDAVLYYVTAPVSTSTVSVWHKTDNGNMMHWDPFAICGISLPTYTGPWPVGGGAASNAGSQFVLAFQCSNKGHSEIYFLDIKTGVFNEIAQIPTANWSDCTVTWSADDQMVLIQGKDQSGKTEIYLLNAQDLQTKSPATPRLIWSGESSQTILQPVPFRSDATENRPPVVTSSSPNATNTPLWTGTSTGNLIAFTSDRTGNPDIYVARSDGTGATDLTNGSEGNDNAVWSPDGNKIAFLHLKNGSSWVINVMNPDGTNLRQVSGDGITIYYSWSPDFQILVWSPDSQKIAYLVSQPLDPSMANGPAKMTLKIVDLDGNVLQSLDLGIFSVVNQLRWSPDGHSLDYVATQVVTDASGASKVTESDIDQISLDSQLPDVLVKSDHPIDAWISSGQIITYLVRDTLGWNLMRADRPGQTRLATWLPDSKQCGFARLSKEDAASYWNVYAGSSLTRWSPDGKRLLLKVTCMNAVLFYLGSLDGQFVELLNSPVFSSSGGADAFSWSPDGHSIIFTSDRDSNGNLDLYELNVEAVLKDPSTRPIRITTSGFAESNPDWQP